MSLAYIKHPNDILSECHIINPPIALEQIATRLGAKITYKKLDNHEGSLSAPLKFGIAPHIRINNHKSVIGRQRFSLAHEIGHLVNDPLQNFSCTKQDMDEFSKGKSEKNNLAKELRANRFAVDLLMPKNLFIQSLSSQDITTNTVIKLAEQYQVSKSAAVIRIIKLSNQACMSIFYWRGGNKDRIRRNFYRSPALSKDVCTIKDRHFPKPDKFNISREVKTDKWIRHGSNIGDMVIESTLEIGDYAYMTLLWWKDEYQIK